MRRVALVLTAAAFAATAVPASAITRTIHVPWFDCTITVETNDLAFSANNRGFHVHRYGQNDINSTC
jgi:photosystem II stability/assembly factor-like uncharacterized protein